MARQRNNIKEKKSSQVVTKNNLFHAQSKYAEFEISKIGCIISDGGQIHTVNSQKFNKYRSSYNCGATRDRYLVNKLIELSTSSSKSKSKSRARLRSKSISAAKIINKNLGTKTIQVSENIIMNSGIKQFYQRDWWETVSAIKSDNESIDQLRDKYNDYLFR